jgi:hypothetical protein
MPNKNSGRYRHAEGHSRQTDSPFTKINKEWISANRDINRNTVSTNLSEFGDFRHLQG